MALWHRRPFFSFQRRRQMVPIAVPTGRVYVKVGGAFVLKPTLVKASGTFVENVVLTKASGTFT